MLCVAEVQPITLAWLRNNSLSCWPNKNKLVNLLNTASSQPTLPLVGLTQFQTSSNSVTGPSFSSLIVPEKQCLADAHLPLSSTATKSAARART
jgi:hypothetical protein